MILVKFWMHISDEEQLRRFERRSKDPLKVWKLTDEDWRNRKKRNGVRARRRRHVRTHRSRRSAVEHRAGREQAVRAGLRRRIDVPHDRARHERARVQGPTATPPASRRGRPEATVGSTSARRCRARMVAVAQLVRAPGCGPGGRGFNSPRSPQVHPRGEHGGLAHGGSGARRCRRAGSRPHARAPAREGRCRAEEQRGVVRGLPRADERLLRGRRRRPGRRPRPSSASADGRGRLCRRSPPHLFTAFPEGAPPELPADHIHPPLHVEWPAGCRGLLDALPGGPIALDELTMPFRAALTGRPVSSALPILSECKRVKSPDELECIRRAQSINERAMLDVEALVAPGTFSKDLSAAFLRRIFELGASSNTVDPIFQVMPQSLAEGPLSLTGRRAVPDADRSTASSMRRRGDLGRQRTQLRRATSRTSGARGASADRRPTRQRDQFRRWRDVIDRVLDVVRPGATGADLTRAAGTAGGRRPMAPAPLSRARDGHRQRGAAVRGYRPRTRVRRRRSCSSPGWCWCSSRSSGTTGDGGYRAEEIVAVTDTGYRLLTDHHYLPYD